MALHLAMLYFLIARNGQDVHGPATRNRGLSAGLVEASLYRAGAAAAPSGNSPSQKDAPRVARQTKAPHVIGLADIRPPRADSGSGTGALQQGAAPADAATGTTGDGADTAQDFQQKVLEHIRPYLRYPNDAGRARPEGVTELFITMDRSGLLLGVWVRQTSGSLALDREAVATIFRAQPLPEIPAQMPDPLTLTLPVTFAAPS